MDGEQIARKNRASPGKIGHVVEAHLKGCDKCDIRTWRVRLGRWAGRERRDAVGKFGEFWGTGGRGTE